MIYCERFNVLLLALFFGGKINDCNYEGETRSYFPISKTFGRKSEKSEGDIFDLYYELIELTI